MKRPIAQNGRVVHRADFAHHCNALGLTHMAVEVGTDRGVFARQFLEQWQGETLFCVDPYEQYDEMPFGRDGDFAMATALLAPYARRCKIVQCASVVAAQSVEPTHQMSFVYIDGAHDHDNVAVDLRAWWPRVKPGGLLAGHDYCDSHPGVVEAVDAFAREIGATVFKTQDYYAPSWWICKLGEAG